jgi:anti-sigma regulatory factor (Ser/Thr protein kinase)
MATIRLSFSPFAAHVRTARLVGVAVARRAGVADTALDEVRLAIGEACSRAVALHRRHALTDMILVELRDDDLFTVRVTDRAPGDPIPEQSRGIRGEQQSGAAPVGLLEAVQVDDVDVDVFGRTEDEIDAISEEDVAVGMGLALLAGLVEDLAVRPAATGSGTEVEMSWPTGTHR